MPVPFSSLETNQRKACKGEKEALHVGETARKSWEVREAVVVAVDQFCAQHILDVHLPCAPLTEQMPNQNQANIYE